MRIQNENEDLIESDELLSDSILNGDPVFIVTIDSTFFVSLDWNDSTVILYISGRSTVNDILDVLALHHEFIIYRPWKRGNSIFQKLNMLVVKYVIWILQNLCFIFISDPFKYQVISLLVKRYIVFHQILIYKGVLFIEQRSG